MGDMQVGSQVCNPDGSVARVIQIHPQGIKPVYKITFVDGAVTRATGDHLWLYKRTCCKTKSIRGSQKIATTEQLMDLTTSLNKILIPLCEPVRFTKTYKEESWRELQIDPYILGVFLGDGCMSDCSRQISFTSIDKEIIDRVADKYPSMTMSKKEGTDALHCSITKDDRVRLITALEQYGLYGKLSDAKFIPARYLYSTIEDRFEILRGLMDTDGYADSRGHLQYCSISEQLAKDVQWIVRSLGGKATITNKIGSYRKDGVKIECSKVYMVYMQLPINSEAFYLQRKKDRCVDKFNGGFSKLQRRIISIEPDGEEECQCITVDHPNGLYITDDFIVTHNSWAMRIKFVLLCMNYGGLRVLLLRRTLPELRENHILPLQAMLHGVAKYSTDEKAFTFPNNSRLKLGYCDSEGDMFQYQGQEYDVIGFEEATLFTWAMVQFILTCNRSTRPDFKARAYYTMNPGGDSHAEFKRLFIDRNFQGNEKAEDYHFIPAKVYDNKVLMESNPEYIEILKALPDELRKAHLDGDWNIFVGQVFSEFRQDIHVEDAFDIPKSWIKFRAMDWGFSKPYAVIWGAVDHDGVIHIYRELYGCKDGKHNVGTQETAKEVAKQVRMAEKGEKVSYGVADPACWAKTGHEGGSIAESFEKEKVYWIRADNDRLQGKMEVHARLRGDGKIPGIKIFRACRHLIRTLPMLAYDKHRVEDIDTNMEDHIFDSLRYLLMSRPYKPRQEEGKRTKDYKEFSEVSDSSWMGVV
jgi:phage terminase large subunit